MRTQAAAAFLGCFLALAAAARPAFCAQLLARVEPGWSPFVAGPLPPEAGPAAGLFLEARRLLASEPGRVAEVLRVEDLPPGRTALFSRGLRADALYLLGRRGLGEARKLYRAVATQESSPEEQAWAEFMLGNIQKIQGFEREAEVAYRASLKGGGMPWRAAVLFDLAALELEAGRPAEATGHLEEWLREAGKKTPGRALVLSLLAEALAAAPGGGDEALARFAEARSLAPEAWLARPESGRAIAPLFRKAGKVGEAVQLLEMIPRNYPGTLDGARARLDVGEIWEAAGKVPLALRSYALLLDEGATRQEGATATLRIAFLGAEHGPGVRLLHQHAAYRLFFRPAPVLEEASRGGDPLSAQKALRALGLLAKREDRWRDALRLQAKAFQDYPKSPESGRAYEAYMELLEETLARKLEAGAHAEVVELYADSRANAAWEPLRDRGRTALSAARAYLALGVPKLALELYEELSRRGTRAARPTEIEQLRLEATAKAGDYTSLSALAAGQPSDRDFQLKLARSLADQGRLPEARERYRRASDLASEPAERLAIMVESDRLLEESGRVDDLLANLAKRDALREKLPAGPQREALARSDALAEARLRFSRGDYAGAAQAYGRLSPLSPEDLYLLALSERRRGRSGRARELFSELAKGGDPTLVRLAHFYVQLSEAEEASREKLPRLPQPDPQRRSGR
jgi:hypothetical protein